jgi:hypothetical protein
MLHFLCQPNGLAEGSIHGQEDFVKIKYYMMLFVVVAALCAAISQPAFAKNPGRPGQTVYDTGNPGAVHPLTVTCSGNGCTGLDPVQTGCSTQETPQTLATGNFTWSEGGGTGHTWQLQMRYSPVCETRWTRLVQTDAHGATLNGSAGYIQIGMNATQEKVSNVYDGAYTNMIYDPTGSTTANSLADSGSAPLSSFNFK